MKKIILFILISSLLGCKSPKTDFENTSNFTIESTEKIGGKYQLSIKEEYKKLTPKLFSKSSAHLKNDSSEITIMDLHENETNYLWYAGIIGKNEFYRFISDKSMDIINFEKLDTTKIKEELTGLKND